MASQNHPLKSEIHPAAKGYTADKIRTNSGERYKSRSPLCWRETCSWSRMVVPLNECCRGIFLFWRASPATFLKSTNYCFFACLLQKDASAERNRKRVVFMNKYVKIDWKFFLIMVKYFYISLVLCLFAGKGRCKTGSTQKLRHHFRGRVLQRTLLRAVMYKQ